MKNGWGPWKLFPVYPMLLLGLLSACEDRPRAPNTPSPFVKTGSVRSGTLDEISGIQAGSGSDWLVQNDSGKPLVHVINLEGQHLAAIQVSGARNRDWESLAVIPSQTGPLLVIGDTGDNLAQRKSIRLYFLSLPAADASGRYPRRVELHHQLELGYPDGPRDCEAMAFDPDSEKLLLVSKRDVPPRLYGVNARAALREDKLTLAFLGTVPGLRPPTPTDVVLSPQRGAGVSQPTGMDISPDGRLAAIITYRSLYLFEREEGKSWPEAFLQNPREFVGPPGLYEEAVGFSPDQSSVIITTERLPAPIYRLRLEPATE